MKKIFTSMLMLAVMIMIPFAASAATYTVAGSAAILNGDASWAETNAANDMTLVDGSLYQLTIQGISVEAGTYEFKIVEDHSWTNNWPAQNYKVTIEETAKYDIVYSFNADTKDIGCRVTKVGAFEGSTEKTYTVAGSQAVLGTEWNINDTSNDMTKGDDGIYRLVKENVALTTGTTYEFKIAVNHDWGTAYPSSNASFTVDADGQYNVTFTFNEDTKEVGATAQPAGAQPSVVTFDFTNESLRGYVGESMTDVKGYIYNETYTVSDTKLQLTAGSAPSRIYTDKNRGTCLVTYKDYCTFTFTAPTGKAITQIEFTAAGSSNINNFTASSGTIEGMVWTGNTSGVRFVQGGTSYLANAIVTLADKTEETTALPDIAYTEATNIAAFNALDAGTYVKLALTNAEVIGISADGYSTVFIQDATGGTFLQYTSLNEILKEKNKLDGFVYTVKRVASSNTQLKETEDTPKSQFTTTAISDYTILEGTIAELNKAENLGRVVKLTGVSFEATSATAGTLKQGSEEISVNNGNATANQQLHKVADWAKGDTKENLTVIGILNASSATKNQILPISMVEGGAVEGDGSKENPYTVAQLLAQKEALAASGSTVWVKANLKGLGEDGQSQSNADTEATNSETGKTETVRHLAGLFSDGTADFVAYSWSILGQLDLSDLTNTQDLLIALTYGTEGHPYGNSANPQYASNYEPTEAHFSLAELHNALTVKIENGLRGYHVASSYVVPQNVIAVKVNAGFSASKGAYVTYTNFNGNDSAFVTPKDAALVLMAGDGTYDFVLSSALFEQTISNGNSMGAGTQAGVNAGTTKNRARLRFVNDGSKAGFERNSDENCTVTLQSKDEVFLQVSSQDTNFYGKWEWETAEKNWISWGGGTYATGIATPHASLANYPSQIYNLQGMKLSKLQKGINIVDGKKILVK